jgi:hypothetical protein
MIGSSGPRPPLLEEPVSALTTLETGEDPGAVLAPPLFAGRAEPGAVASASAAALRPALPCLSSARSVDVLIVPPEDPPPWVPPAGTMVLLGRLPFAVGTSSWYWLTPEFPGGAIVRIFASAPAGSMSNTNSPITALLIENSLRSRRAEADSSVALDPERAFWCLPGLAEQNTGNGVGDDGFGRMTNCHLICDTGHGIVGGSSPRRPSHRTERWRSASRRATPRSSPYRRRRPAF